VIDRTPKRCPSAQTPEGARPYVPGVMSEDTSTRVRARGPRAVRSALPCFAAEARLQAMRRHPSGKGGADTVIGAKTRRVCRFVP
jgi:hypothetical protein